MYRRVLVATDLTDVCRSRLVDELRMAIGADDQLIILFARCELKNGAVAVA